MIAAVVGACGAVGTAVAGRLAERIEFDELLLADDNGPALEVAVMDIAPVGARHGTRVRRASTLADVGAADVVVFCAARPHRAGVQRADMLAENADILDSVLAGFDNGAPRLLLVVSNPVDALVHRASRVLPRTLVVGHSMNDTIRLRHEIARILGLQSSAEVGASWLGAHGGRGVLVWGDAENLDLNAKQRAAIEASVRGWYDLWQRHGTTRTTAITTSYGVAQLLDAYLGGAPATLVLSMDALLYGSAGVPLGLPVRVANGSLEVCHWSLPDDKLAALLDDASFVRTMVDWHSGKNNGSLALAPRSDPVES